MSGRVSTPPTAPVGGPGEQPRDDPGRVDAGGRGDRLILVGREHELGIVRKRLLAARGGAGGVIAIAGEPGIGKTSLGQVAGELTRAGGGSVVWGRCVEGEWAPPYGVWSEVFADLVKSVAPARLEAVASGLGPGAASLAALVPPLRAVAPTVESGTALPPLEERFRLHEAASRLLLGTIGTNDGASGASLVVLDDLQWADRGTLDLLTHLGRLLLGARLVILLAYRDGALDREHPLTETLASLRREAAFEPISLHGLRPAAVSELIARAAHRKISHALGSAIHGETNGNPFYVREVTRHLIDEGILDVSLGGPAAGVDIRALGVPEGVRQVVLRRLTRLSEAARQVIEATSLFTAGVDFSVLAGWTGLGEDDLLNALDEAIATHFLRPAVGKEDTYEFSHAIVRQAFVAERERNPSRSARLHRRAAAAIAAAHPDRSHMAGELAIQYRASATLPGAGRGVAPALVAAEQARVAHAAEQTVFFLRLARDLSWELDPSRRGGVLSELATAEAEALFLTEAEATTVETLAAWRESNADPEQIASFLATMTASLKLSGAPVALWWPLTEQGLGLIGDDRGLTWARLTLLRDPVEPVSSETVRAGRWLGFVEGAADVARRLGDEDDHARTIDSFDARDRDQTWALLDLARTWSRPTASLRVLSAAANDLQYRHGAFRESLAVWDEVRATAERLGAVSWQAQAVGQSMLLHLTQGDFDQARAAAAEATALMARLGPQGGIAGEPDELALERATAFALALALGADWTPIADAWTRTLRTIGAGGNYVTTLNGPLFAALAAVCHARAGAASDALRLVDGLIPILLALDPRRSNQAQNGTIAFAAEAVWLLGADDRAAVYKRLALAVIDAGIGDYPQTSNELTVARMASQLGEAAASAHSFDRARAQLDASGQRPLRAIVDHDQAIALLSFDPTDRARAAAGFAAAGAAFTDLGMAEWADRTRERLGRLVGASGQVLPAGLTEREAEVLRLVAKGRSDRQIANELFVSPRTVNAHVRHLLMKSERVNRTELSLWAAEQGLVGVGRA